MGPRPGEGGGAGGWAPRERDGNMVRTAWGLATTAGQAHDVLTGLVWDH